MKHSSRDERIAAVRALENELAALMASYRRVLAKNAQRLSPGMLPGTYKLFTTIAHLQPVTASALAEHFVADKGHISRTVRDLEALGLVVRTPDPADRRSSLLSATPDGMRRLAQARAPKENALVDALDEWAIEDIRGLTRLLHALTTGASPGDS